MAAKRLKESLITRKLVVARLGEIFEVAVASRTDATRRSSLKIRYRQLEDLYEDFNSVHKTILNLASATEEDEQVFLESQEVIRKEVDSQYFEIVDIYEDLFPPVTVSATSVATAVSATSAPIGGSQAVLLPKLNVPIFDGDLRAWPTFRDLYESLVHNNSSLADIQKFQYLTSYLIREPLSLVKTLPLSAGNYAIAYNSLLDRYNNNRLLASCYWQQIQQIPVIVEESPSALRHLLNTVNENLEALKALGLPVDAWEFVLFSIISDKLDKATRRAYELEVTSKDIPAFSELKRFLEGHCQSLESLELLYKRSAKSGLPKLSGGGTTGAKFSQKTSLVSVSDSRCSLCSKDHLLFKCATFTQLTPEQRLAKSKELRVCFNCLRSGHSVRQCTSSSRCRSCQAAHHSLLHLVQKPRTVVVGESNRGDGLSSTNTAPQPAASSSSDVNACTSVSSQVNRASVLLSTIVCQLLDRWGNPHTVRALLDPGSQASFVVDSCVKRLKLSRSKDNTAVFGLGHASTASRGSTRCHIRPCDSIDMSFPVDAIIVPQICSILPNCPVDASLWQHGDSFPLADPGWNEPGPIDVLLGADVYPSVLRPGILPNSANSPMAIQTVFGWSLLGPLPDAKLSTVHSFCLQVSSQLDTSLLKFWETEEVPAAELGVLDRHDPSEQLFCTTHFRELDGRFGVALPFKSDVRSFPGSRDIADRRLLALERRLVKDPHLRTSYGEFMQDYVDSNHMSRIPDNVDVNSYFLPHHCVVTGDADHPKVRVVFDASSKADNGLSLNDTLHVGPRLQADIACVLMRFRCFEFAFVCDIRQMYRQILMLPAHRQYQLIRWRFSPNGPIDTYRLNTVTYGVSSSPFLAIRVLLQLAEEYQTQFPLACHALQNNLYVDDIVCGQPTLELACQLQQQLIDLLGKGCLELRKWAATHPQLLRDIPLEHQQLTCLFDKEAFATTKVLGLQWQASSDSFRFTVVPKDGSCTKRTILSEIARIYDPLGFVSPTSFWAKHLIQRLWTAGIGWDESPSADILSTWEQFKEELPQLSQVTIPRFILTPHVMGCQLHAFCDASEAGYAAVIYLRLVDALGNVVIRLITAKSKVSPLKRISIPRLELCAAVVLVNLVNFVRDTLSLSIKIDATVAWSDSMVVLGWIRSSAHRWKTFVANRVTHIQDRVAPEHWRHVPSADNPADPASRGLLPGELVVCSLWWAGPAWLKFEASSWPDPRVSSSAVSDGGACEERNPVALVASVTPNFILELLNRFSSLRKVQGIIAYCRRLCRGKSRPVGPLTELELHQASLTIVKQVQVVAFADDILQLRSGRPCSKPLRKLAAFLDESGHLRVGGRLRHAPMSFDIRHPLLLPRVHRLTELLIQQVHQRHCHPGLSTTVHLLQQNFWIMSGRRAVRQYLSSCYRCFRARPAALTPPMGNLPASRVSQVKPFSVVGIDFGGPFSVISKRQRGARASKAYICVFVCFATKAIHIELVSDLSTEAFIASLRRFVGRRGRCSHIHSDNGTNFVGANRELLAHMQRASEQEAISWHFNPPAAPHLGGLWEGGIKSVKTHLARVIGDQVLTFEELTTVLVQIEALLNSRPLCALSNDPNDLSALTPGHFLTLEPVTAVPDSDLSHLSIPRLSRWQLVQQMQQAFWQRWHTEYLHSLQQRGKWVSASRPTSISVGDLVLIKNELLPPLKWRFGRIESVHPGTDGVIRVATVHTTTGTYKRPLVKLCALPKYA